MRTSVLGFVVPFAALLGLSSSAQAEGWSFAVQPYLWLPTINTTLRFSAPPGGGAPESRVGPNDYLSNLQMLLMVNGEIRKDDWAIISDVVYLNFSGERSHITAVDFNVGGARNPVSSSVDTGSRTTFTGAEWALAGSRVVARGTAGTFEVLSGVRYFGLKATADWSLNTAVTGPGGTTNFPASGSISDRVNLWNAIFGFRGDAKLGETNWHVPYYADFGVGGDSNSWQALIGLAYRFKWGDASLVYRHIAYDQPSDKLIQNLSFSGPAIGVNFRF